jgi:hypothetical protein
MAAMTTKRAARRWFLIAAVCLTCLLGWQAVAFANNCWLCPLGWSCPFGDEFCYQECGNPWYCCSTQYTYPDCCQYMCQQCNYEGDCDVYQCIGKWLVRCEVESTCMTQAPQVGECLAN